MARIDPRRREFWAIAKTILASRTSAIAARAARTS
jgi:hypothetical protein